MDLQPGAPANNPFTGMVQPSTTTQLPSVSSTGGFSQKILSPEAQAAFEAQQQAETERLAAMKGPEIAAMPGSGDVAADLASQQGSQAALAKYQAENPAVPTGPVPTMGGKPLAMPAVARAPGAPLPPKTSQEFNASPEMQGPRTLEAAQDESAAYKAVATQRVAQEQQQQQAALARQTAEKMQAAHAWMEKTANEYKQASHITSLYDDMSTPRKILAALALGMGSYGASITHTENYAQKTLQHLQEVDYQKKKARLDASLEELRRAGAAPEQIMKAHEAGVANILAMQKAQLEVIGAKADAMLAPFPQKQQAAKLAIANQAAADAEKRATFLREATERTQQASTTHEGMKVTQVEGKDQVSQGRLPTSKDVQDAATSEEMAKKADKLEAHMKAGRLPTPDQVSEYFNRERQVVAQAREEGESAFKNLVGRVERGIGIMPETAYPKGMTAAQREALRLQTDLWHAQATQFYGGMSWLTNPETYEHVSMSRGFRMGDKQADILGKTRDVISQARTVNEMQKDVSKAWREEGKVRAQGNSQMAPGAPSAPPRPAAISGSQLAKLSKKEQADYVAAKLVRPDSPDYAGAQAALRKLSAKAAGK